ncbi:MAG: TerB family tellurite resistance protein [Pseudomonadales bacterium]|nr:TerB family tellurite resistance protein [Pseudomonadales bacterium]MBO6563826.1 TerB family tellurite resistance protein [Pseudomonadales bacterium]MBO6594650.1 TerB family tellurite resistance protein [Pseudomonadales bacterium]MBO6655421.1 TerB family tellurite resistance protein [Pseudomonadales bacterium]MBO6701155.1 TerB family tellurite resistance protein [Pseudomonadales bacterium]
MSISSLGGVLKIFGGGEPSPEEQTQLFKEVALMTLARATAADSNIKQIEVEMVRDVLKAHTGEDFPVSDIRVAAQSAIFERAPLERFVSASSKKLKWQNRLSIARALAEVIEADDRVTEFELNFFNQIASALDLTPAQLIGLELKE